MISGELKDMLLSYNDLHEQYEESDQLIRFVDVLKKFNKNEPIDIKIQNRLVKYFDYRWKNHRYHCFTEKYSNIVEQIPEEIIDILLKSMIYREFLEKYSHNLQYEKEDTHLHARYTWEDDEYKNYMRHIIAILEPREEMPGTTIINELDDFLEVTFFIKGKYQTGYTLNQKVIHVQTFTLNLRGNAIGAYDVTFHKKATIIYQIASRCSGFFIRKANWHQMLNDLDPTLCRIIKKNYVKDYIEFTKFPVIKSKLIEIAKYQKSVDPLHHDVITLWDLNIINKNIKHKKPRKQSLQDMFDFSHFIAK